MSRYVILAEGALGPLTSKTANQAIRYIPDQVVAVLDSRHAGRRTNEILGFGRSVPIVATLSDSLPYTPTALLVGIAPAGGRLPRDWYSTLVEAINAGLDIVSGLHTFLTDDPVLQSAARQRGVQLVDLRKVPPEYERIARGSWKTRKARTILTVGTDCNVGKMTASLEIHREFLSRGLASAFIATGQTGILIEGAGIAIDSVVSDYVAGAIEGEIDDAVARGSEFIHVEGQGALLHQGYSGVTLGVLHGTMPDALILVHHPIRGEDEYGRSLDDLRSVIHLYELLLAPFKKTGVVAIAVNGAEMSETEIQRAIEEIHRQTGLPTANVLSGGRRILADALVKALRP